VVKYFTYVRGNHGPEAQIWYGELTDGGGKAKANLEPLVKLGDDDERTLAQLALAYPVEAEK